MKSIVLFCIIFLASLSYQSSARTEIYDSGGPLMPEQAAYDVTYYDLSVQVSPQDSSISGTVLIKARVVQPLEYFVIDLDTLLNISAVSEIYDNQETTKTFERDTGKIWIALDRTHQSGEELQMYVKYSGRPRVAPAPPWQGGLTWAQTAGGAPWIATSCQGEGSDIWWPSKDHVSDEPDSMHIRVRVPDTLFCASNGKLINTENHPDKTVTYHWFVSTTINLYNVALNIAPYKIIEQDYLSTSDDIIPVKFWVLPEDYEKGKAFMPQIIDHMRFFEELLGPYPFRADKYGVVQTPHLGMEHQTIIAYGSNFDNTAMTGMDWGFDALHHHELAHEWWGNLVTNIDWKDMWLHEGFGSYMQALYVEKLSGKTDYFKMMRTFRMFDEHYTVAPYTSHTIEQIVKAPVYVKGAWMLHMLRYLVGDDVFFTILRRMAYPEPAMEKITDGSHTRFAATTDFQRIAEKYSGQELDWFFEIYARQAKFPVLEARIQDNTLYVQWHTRDGITFNMPVEVALNNDTVRVELTNNKAVLKIPQGVRPQIDPRGWLLYKSQALKQVNNKIRQQNYADIKEPLESLLLFPEEKSAYDLYIQHVNYVHNKSGNEGENLQKLSGEYSFSGRFSVALEYRDDQLIIDGWPRGGYSVLYPLSDHKFLTMNSGMIINFLFNEDGLITGFEARSSKTKRKFTAKKIAH